MIKEILNHRRILSFSIHEKDNCALALSGGYTLSIGCVVRLVNNKNIFVCANDHGHMFGLEAPFDAESKIKEAMNNKEIKDVEFNQNTGDLILHIDSGMLQVICNSGGYENYQINGPDNSVIVIHGGNERTGT